MAEKPIWIIRDYLKCSGCRKCEIACSLHHENKIWPEASRIRVFMLVPGAEFPHFCTQCNGYPCVKSCPVDALHVSEGTGAVLVNQEKCTGCGQCIDACPGKIPHMHPTENYALICDLCGGDPECVKVCREGGWNVLKVVQRDDGSYHLYARTPEEITQDLVVNLYGEAGEELI
ncbi:MAG: 4Fe-4S dicluster domain-containing protein [Thermoproteota archaeon]|nr:4Fe-4S dicluster domain-containing protein [Thermoproteota archaeon]